MDPARALRLAGVAFPITTVTSGWSSNYSRTTYTLILPDLPVEEWEGEGVWVQKAPSRLGLEVHLYTPLDCKSPVCAQVGGVNMYTQADLNREVAKAWAKVWRLWWNHYIPESPKGAPERKAVEAALKPVRALQRGPFPIHPSKCAPIAGAVWKVRTKDFCIRGLTREAAELLAPHYPDAKIYRIIGWDDRADKAIIETL